MIVPPQQFITMPQDELRILYTKMRNALDLKYKILEILLPLNTYRLDAHSSVLEMRDANKDNFQKLKDIRKLIEEFDI